MKKKFEDGRRFIFDGYGLTHGKDNCNETQLNGRVDDVDRKIQNRLDDLDDKIVDIQNRAMRLDLKATHLKAKDLGDEGKMKEKDQSIEDLEDSCLG
ncbi:hypothetical protein M9H77_30985 [Catharanthus roseus]|uniref:Uncharacterized protein n=1 Tax=Catharanthus roseus TaxID=4058 RepID=A0ACC0A327_CATRO|nr:hypothetical protein M9H77_30985 [Catharanthus roseus]